MQQPNIIQLEKRIIALADVVLQISADLLENLLDKGTLSLREIEAAIDALKSRKPVDGSKLRLLEIEVRLEPITRKLMKKIGHSKLRNRENHHASGHGRERGRLCDGDDFARLRKIGVSS